jgi:O-antigen/teichoic acid export membrane protein
VNKRIKNLEDLVRGAGISMIFGVLGFGIMFFYRLILARYFGASDYGLYTMMETIILFLVLLSSLGMQSGITRYLPIYHARNNNNYLRGFLRYSTGLPLIVSTLLSILLFIFAKDVAAFFNFPPSFVTMLRIASLIIPLATLQNLILQVLIAYKKILSQNLCEFIYQSTLIIGASIIIINDLSVPWTAGVLALAYALSALFALYQLRKIIKNLTGKVAYKPREWLLFSMPLFLSGMLGYIITWTDNFFIGKILTSTELGVYSVAFSLAMFLTFFQKAFGKIFQPMIAQEYGEKDISEIQFIYKKSAAWIFSLSFPVYLIFLLYSKHIIKIIYGPEFVSGYFPLAIIATGLIISIATGFGNHILILYKKTKTLLIMYIFFSSLNIILNYLLLPKLGIIGAAIASAISMSLMNLVTYSMVRKILGPQIDWPYYAKFILSGIFSIMVALVVLRLSSNTLIKLISSGLIYGSVYVLSLLLLRTFTKDDFHIVLKIEKRLGLNLSFIKKIVRRFY